MAMRPTPEHAAAPPAPDALHPERDTFPKLVRLNAERLPRKVAIREKDLGIWQSYTWRDYLERSRLIALGLASLGFARGDKVAIVGDNRPELYWAVTATQGLGGVPVPIYQDSIEKEMQYVVDHAEVRFAVVEDQEQVDKLLHVREQCPRLEFIVYEDPRGMRGYRAAVPPEPARPGGAGPGVRRRASRPFRVRDGQGHGRRGRHHLLHVGHDGRAEGHHPVASQPDRHGDECGARGGAAERRGDPVLSAHGLGGRPHLFLRAVDHRRLHRQLSRRARPPCSPTSRRSGRPTSSRPRGSGRTS